MRKGYIKWVGGKSRILKELVSHFPNKINRFIEPFVGTGVVSLNVDATEYILSDFNKDLIYSHKNAITNPESMLSVMKSFFDGGFEPYYENRTLFNSLGYDLERSALFVYLNRHGYNGLCRYNNSGGYNVPVGKSKVLFPENEIREFSNYFKDKNVELLSADFEETIDRAELGDLVYCDPPYVPVSATNSVVGYTSKGFTLDDQYRLVEAAKRAQKRGATVIISNHYNDLTVAMYGDADTHHQVSASRTVSRSNSTRGKVMEIIAIYQPKQGKL